MSTLDLTEREAEVLYWVAQGKTSPGTAIILGSALKTVKKTSPARVRQARRGDPHRRRPAGQRSVEPPRPGLTLPGT